MAIFFRALEDQLSYKLFHMRYYILEYYFKCLKFWAKIASKRCYFDQRHVSSPSDSLVTVVRTKAKCRFRASAILFFNSVKCLQ